MEFCVYITLRIERLTEGRRAEMRLEIFEDFHDGMELAVFDGTDVVAILYTFDRNEIDEVVEELKGNRTAYFGWNHCYNTENVVESTIADGIEKYDEDGNAIDITENPWTLQELYDDLRNYSEWKEELSI